METEKIKGIIEAMLFSSGRIISKDELVLNLEISKEEIENIIKKKIEE